MSPASPLQPTSEQSAAIAGLAADRPVVMVNLLQFKKPDGIAHYLRYGRAVAPLIQRAGGTVRYAGFVEAVVLADNHCWWDAIVVVEYPSPVAFSEMVTSRDYARAYPHRVAAVDRAELVATSTSPAG